MSMKEGSSTGSENISTNPSTVNIRNCDDDDDIIFVAEVDNKKIARQEESEAQQDGAEAEQAVNRPIEEIFLSSDSETEVEVLAVLPKRPELSCGLSQSHDDSMVQSNKVKYIYSVCIQ